MAEQPKPPTPADDKRAAVPADLAKGAFKVTHPTIVNGHVAQIPIANGVGYTDSASLAHKSLEYGCTVIRTATGKEAWPKEPRDKKAK